MQLLETHLTPLWERLALLYQYQIVHSAVYSTQCMVFHTWYIVRGKQYVAHNTSCMAHGT